jgi:hypothetical protein
MKHPPQKKRKGLQVRMQAAEINSRGTYAPKVQE